MLLTLSTTRAPATDLGWLLHKNPSRAQSIELPFGEAHVFYPVADDAQCTAALLLDVSGDALDDYVSDRPWTASSLLSVAIARVFGSALAGRCAQRPELVDAPLPLEARLSVVRADEALVTRLFAPLGYAIGASVTGPYRTLTLAATRPLRELLTHLYVLVPVLDGEKHYWVGDDEIDKLLKHGEGWLDSHPERELITRRYLKHQKSLTREALARLVPDELPAPARPSLQRARIERVAALVKELGAKRVLDLGCGDGELLAELLPERGLEALTGVDVSWRSLERARKRLELDRLPEQLRKRVSLLHGALTYRDARLSGYDVATIVEVIEHLDPERLATFARVVFEHARPGTVLLTTPNAERTPGDGGLRHADHRFEWTRAQLEEWSGQVASRFGYRVRCEDIGAEGLTQLAVFTK